MKIHYYHAIINEKKLNMKETWSIVRGAIGKLNDKSGFPNEFIVNNNTISDKLEISESFNKYCSSIGLKPSQN